MLELAHFKQGAEADDYIKEVTLQDYTDRQHPAAGQSCKGMHCMCPQRLMACCLIRKMSALHCFLLGAKQLTQAKAQPVAVG